MPTKVLARHWPRFAMKCATPALLTWWKSTRWFWAMSLVRRLGRTSREESPTPSTSTLDRQLSFWRFQAVSLSKNIYLNKQKNYLIKNFFDQFSYLKLNFRRVGLGRSPQDASSEKWRHAHHWRMAENWPVHCGHPLRPKTSHALWRSAANRWQRKFEIQIELINYLNYYNKHDKLYFTERPGVLGLVTHYYGRVEFQVRLKSHF